MGSLLTLHALVPLRLSHPEDESLSRGPLDSCSGQLLYSQDDSLHGSVHCGRDSGEVLATIQSMAQSHRAGVSISQSLAPEARADLPRRWPHNVFDADDCHERNLL